MVNGDPIEEESMTAVLLPVDRRLLERTDLTVDDLVDLPEDLRYELIEGRLVSPRRPRTEIGGSSSTTMPSGASRATGSSIFWPSTSH
jgi:hypothetical protein